MSDLLGSFDGKTWVLTILSLIIVIAYFMFLFTNNTNVSNVQTIFQLVIGYWFGTGSVALGANTVIKSQAVK